MFTEFGGKLKIYDGAFFAKIVNMQSLTIFAKMLFHRYLTGF